MSFIEKNKEIISLLEKHLIFPRDGLNDIYDRIIRYYNRSNQITEKPTEKDKIELEQILPTNLLNKNELVGSFSYLTSEPIRTMAIDFPVHFRLGKPNRKTIMVCAMDSLPPNDEKVDVRNSIYKDPNGIIPWAPFSIIYNWDLAKGSSKLNIDFFRTLFEDCDIYITDIYKMFFRIGPVGSDVRSNKLPRYVVENLNAHKGILEKEIEIINPDIILTLGNNSRNALYSLYNLKPEKWANDYLCIVWTDTVKKIISIPHISGAANGAKAKILSNAKYNSVSGANNEKLANIVLTSIK